MKEAKYKNLFVPSYIKRYINVKKAFPIEKYNPNAHTKKKENVKRRRPAVGGMTDMLSILGLQLVGRHHSGIDDSINIARVCLQLMKEGFEFRQDHINVKNYSTGNLSEFLALVEEVGKEIPLFEPSPLQYDLTVHEDLKREFKEEEMKEEIKEEDE